jgi:hypothetical protein
VNDFVFCWGLFEELTQVGRRLGLWKDLQVHVHRDLHASASRHGKRELARVTIDRVDLGLKSDGMLRVAIILFRLLQR